MSGFQFTGQTLDNNLVASISGLLDVVDVPNILWGNYLLTIYGVPTIVDGVAFAVPDTLVETSFTALLNAGFLPCTPELDCPYPNTARCPQPTKHLHIADKLTILLYRKSDVLPDVPHSELASKDNNQEETMSASDSRLPPATLGRGQGRLPSKFSFIRIPNVIRYCEHLIFFLCRDDNTVRYTYWMAMLTYIMEYVDGMDFFDEEELGDGYRHFYQAMKNEEFSKMYSLLDELHLDLIEKGLLPASQP